MDEPSVLDYVKSKLMPWKGIKIEIPEPKVDEITPAEEMMAQAAEPPGEGKREPVLKSAEEPKPQHEPVKWPWRVLLALLLALMAQRMFEPPDRNPLAGLILYTAAGGLVVWAVLVKEWVMDFISDDAAEPMPVTIHRNAFLLALAAMVIAFIGFGGNLFTPVNLFLWTLAIIYTLWAFWFRRTKLAVPWGKIQAALSNPKLSWTITPWTILMVLGTALVVFFRFYQLDGVPGEMISDHAEKLLDVNNVLNGQFNIFFPRNTGREFVQMYLTAAVALLTGGKLTYMSLKIGTALAGLLTLPYIYLLGKEIGGKWVGFVAFMLAGIAYWPNVIARIGLRFPLYPLFAAPMLFYLIRGLRRMNRNDFILAGIALGLGLHGYSPMRIVPFVVVILALVYLLHRQAQGKRNQVILAVVILAVAAMVIFLPLARYAVDDPESFGIRALSRVGTVERDYPEPVGQIFISNLAKAWVMPWWDDGEIWVHSVTHRPALDLVTAAFFFIGTLLVLIRYVRKRHWLDLFLIILVPLLMMPSILSLAFPAENPSLNRTGAAYIPVFITAAIAVESLARSLLARFKSLSSRVMINLVLVLLFVWSASQNFDLTINQFGKSFLSSTWNTSQIGSVISQFASTIGTIDTAHVVPYAHWVDTRVVGIVTGNVTKDFALWPENFESTLGERRAQLFILKPDDTAALSKLKSLYPTGITTTYASHREGRDFLIFQVPPKAP